MTRARRCHSLLALAVASLASVASLDDDGTDPKIFTSPARISAHQLSGGQTVADDFRATASTVENDITLVVHIDAKWSGVTGGGGSGSGGSGGGSGAGGSSGAGGASAEPDSPILRAHLFDIADQPGENHSQSLDRVFSASGPDGELVVTVTAPCVAIGASCAANFRLELERVEGQPVGVLSLTETITASITSQYESPTVAVAEEP